MRKSLILMLITSLIMGVFLVSCNSEVSGVSSTGDKLVKVSIAGDNKGISAVGVADNGEDYYWYYKATKTNGGIYITGQTDWKAVKDGNGLKGTNLGYFSAGSWTFEFRAFATATSSYDTGYRYYTSVNVELNDDKSLELTMSGNGLANALLVFPSDLNWGYTPEENSSATVTLSTLGGRKAYMKVYAKAASAETEVLIAKSTKSDITVNGSSATAVFGDFTGINNETDVRLASGEYTLIFKVFVTESSTADPSDNDQQVGEEKALSVTAYLGGVINITKSDSGYAVSDNESGANIVIDSVYNPVSKTLEATIAAPVVPETPETPETAGSNSNTQPSAATTITTTATAVEVEETKKSTVSIPAAALAESTVTVTKSGSGDVTTETVTSTHTLSMQVETQNVETSTYVVTTGNGAVAGINLDLTKTTTTTTQTNNDAPTVQSASAKVTSFNEGKYVTVSTYIGIGLENVQVGYDGNGAQPVFNTSETNPVVATASADDTSNDAGTGYNPTTGLLVFKTNHFSSFVVTSAIHAKIVRNNVNVFFPTLVDAVKSVQEGETIVLMKDLDFSTPAYSGYKWAGSVYNPLEICVNNVTLDLNGHTISNMGNSAIAFGHLLAKDGRVSNVKIKNGTLSAGTTDNVRNSYVLLIAGADGARIENVTTTGGINVCSGSTGVVIDSCNVTGTKYYTVCSQTGSQVTIQGTSYTKNTDNTVANKSMFWIQGASIDSDMVTTSNPTGEFGASSITIASGEFTVDTTNGGVFYLTSGVKPVVKGGTYNINPTAYLADGYCVVENDPTEGKWTVYSCVCYITANEVTTYYTSLQEALDAASNGETITMLKDIEVSGSGALYTYLSTTSDRSAKLDLNGKIIRGILNNAASCQVFKVGSLNGDNSNYQHSASLTILDSAAPEHGYNRGAIIAEPTIYSDSWTVAVSTFSVQRYGALTIDSGKILVEGENVPVSSSAENPYAIDVLTNTGVQPATLVVNGGYIASNMETGVGIRTFCNSSVGTVYLTINSGYIHGQSRAVMLQIPYDLSGNKKSLLNCVINGGTLHSDLRALDVLNFNSTDKTDSGFNITVTGGEYISGNDSGRTKVPGSDILYISYNTSGPYTPINFTDSRSH